MKNLIYLVFASVVSAGMFSMIPDIKVATTNTQCSDIEMVAGKCK